MTEQQLAEIEARCNAATKGPWFVEVFGNANTYLVFGPTIRSMMPGKMQIAFCGNADFDEGNACFIAHARQDIEDLIAEVRRLRDALNTIGYDTNCCSMAKCMNAARAVLAKCPEVKK